MAADPGTYAGRISLRDHPGRLGSSVSAARIVRQLGGMKAQNGLRGDADALARYDAQNERAGRKAGAVDDNTLPGLAHGGKELEIFSHLAAAAGNDADVRHNRPDTDQNESQPEYQPS